MPPARQRPAKPDEERRPCPAQGQSQRQAPGPGFHRSAQCRGQLQAVRGEQPAPRPDPERAGGVLPAQAVPAQWPPAGPGGPAALEPSRKGMIRPDQFISVAEETGLIIPIGKWVVRQACRMSQHLSQVGLGDLHVAINLSPKQFSDPELVASIDTILQGRSTATAPAGARTDRGPAAGSDRRYPPPARRAQGPRLDPGHGRLRHRLFIAELPEEVSDRHHQDRPQLHQRDPRQPDDMEITSAVVAMAHNLKLKVVAEGIETAEQLAFLRRHRCDVGQGYLFDKPIPGRELAERLKRYPRGPVA